MKLSLMVLNAGKASGQAIPITSPQFIIGRDPKCNLRPASAMISKQHCAVIIRAGRVYLKDYDSTNGTFVNDQAIKGEIALNGDDVLKVGPLSFKVVIEEQQAAVNKSTPPPRSRTAPPDDDHAAALLLALEENPGEEPSVIMTTDADDVPGGSTIMEMPAVTSTSTSLPSTEDFHPAAPPEKQSQPAAESRSAETPKPESKKIEKKPAGDSAQSAAQAILDRYRKGHRKSS